MMASKEHWDNIYKTKSSREVSWYEPHLKKSLEIISELHLPKEAEIIDVGAGASTLPDDLLVAGFKNISVLDISKEALKVSRERLGKKSEFIQWIEGDVTEVSVNPESYDCWHDRAVFHFLTNLEGRQKYIKNLKKAVKPCGYALFATFAPNGPLKCSGLEIVRYSAESLHKEIGDAFKLEKQFIEIHKTPFDTTQEFLYCLFRRH